MIDIEKIKKANAECDSDNAAEVLAEMLMSEEVSTWKMFEYICGRYTSPQATDDFREGIDCALAIVTGYDLAEIADIILSKEGG